MTKRKRTESIIHGWRMITLVLLARPIRNSCIGTHLSYYAGWRLVCSVTDGDWKSIQKHQYVTKRVPTRKELKMNFYDKNNTERGGRVALQCVQARTSKRSVKNGCARCVCIEDLCFDGRWQHTPAPMKRSPNPKKQNTGLHTHISFITHIYFSYLAAHLAQGHLPPPLQYNNTCNCERET